MKAAPGEQVELGLLLLLPRSPAPEWGGIVGEATRQGS